MRKLILIYSKPACAYCYRAKKYLEGHKLEYKEIDITVDSFARQFILEQGHKTVPQIYLNGRSIGGYEDLIKLDIKDLK